MQIEKLKPILRSVGRAFVQCLKRFREEPLTEAQEWARMSTILALEGDTEILEDERLRETHRKLYTIIRPYSKFYKGSKKLMSDDIPTPGRN